MNQNGRPWYFWPIIAFVVGFLIGWLVIGWVVWPVTWTNALVQDLRADLRDQYVTMVAESYAQTGNLDQAQKRLEGWSTEQLTRIMSDAQKVLAVEDADAALSVQSLAAALGASAGGTEAAPGQSQVPTRAAAAASSPATGSAATFGRFCAAGLFVFLALAALALLIFLFRRWRLARGEGSTGGGEAPFDASETYTAPAAAAEQ
jgi:uncharacterized membrane-anchored protein YhcB (DUF1043 family)